MHARVHATELQARCRSIGLSSVLTDGTGGVTDVSAPTGPLRGYLDTGSFAGLIRDATSRWSSSQTLSILEPVEGLRLMPFPMADRNATGPTGYVVCIAPGPELERCSLFAAVCRSEGIDPGTVIEHFRNGAWIPADECKRLHILLSDVAGDLRTNSEAEESLGSFTAYLSDAYETITALYAIGRSMTDVAHPEAFVDAVLGRLQETTSFTWAGCVMDDSEGVPEALRGARRWSAQDQSLDEELEGFADWLRTAIETRGSAADGATVLSISDGVPFPLGPQVIGLPLRRQSATIGMLTLGKKTGEDPQVSSYDTLLLEATGGYLQAFLDNVSLYEEQRQLFLGVVKAMTASIDAKDAYTRGHSERVALMGSKLAEAIGLPADEVERVYISGLVHDVGKIGVPERVLCKAGRLTDEEFALIRQHPEIGYNILRDIPAMRPVLPGVLHHHERWDGKGYPHGVAGEEIPLMARLLCLADTFDAMSSNRAYRPGMSRGAAFAEIARCAGTQFDPTLTGPFLALDFTEYDELIASAVQQARHAA